MRILSVGNRFPPWSTGGYEATGPGRCEALRDAGHDVRVLTTQPDPSDRPRSRRPRPTSHRELRWYWRDHRFPPRDAGAVRALERANAARARRPPQPFAPDVVMWWAMGGMSLSLLEQARRAGLPALGVVGDEWIVYGPGGRRLDPPLAAAAGARRRAPRPADRGAGHGWRWIAPPTGRSTPTTRDRRREPPVGGWPAPRSSTPGSTLGRLRRAAAPAPDWSWRLLYCGRIDPRKGIATAIRALALLPDGATLTVHGDGDPEHAASLRRLGARARRRRTGQLQRRTPPSRWPRSTPRATRSCSRSPGASPGVWCRSRRWRRGGRWSHRVPGAARPSISSTSVNCLQFAPDDADGLAAALRRVAGDPELRAALVRRGHATAERFPEQGFHQALELRLREALTRGALGDRGRLSGSGGVGERPTVSVVVPFAGDPGAFESLLRVAVAARAR